MGDIDGLARSIKAVGLLHPVVIRPDGLLIAGQRRVAACRKLGWSGVPVTEVDLDQVARGELAENADRKDFLPSEIDAIRKALAPVEEAAAKERQGTRSDLAPTSAKVSQNSPARSVDKVGAFAGVSGRTVEKIAKVVEAAERGREGRETFHTFRRWQEKRRATSYRSRSPESKENGEALIKAAKELGRRVGPNLEIRRYRR